MSMMEKFYLVTACSSYSLNELPIILFNNRADAETFIQSCTDHDNKWSEYLELESYEDYDLMVRRFHEMHPIRHELKKECTLDFDHYYITELECKVKS